MGIHDPPKLLTILTEKEESFVPVFPLDLFSKVADLGYTPAPRQLDRVIDLERNISPRITVNLPRWTIV